MNPLACSVRNRLLSAQRGCAVEGFTNGRAFATDFFQIPTGRVVEVGTQVTD
jgi:K+ transporter